MDAKREVLNYLVNSVLSSWSANPLKFSTPEAEGQQTWSKFEREVAEYLHDLTPLPLQSAQPALKPPV